MEKDVIDQICERDFYFGIAGSGISVNTGQIDVTLYRDDLKKIDFSDGIIYLAQPATTLSSEEWTTITLVIPEGAANSKLGFTIPSFDLRSGDMVYIDDFTITTSDGSVIKNRGDYEIKKVSEKDAAPLFQRVLMIILLVLLVAAIVGGIGFIISKSVKRFS